MFDVAHDGKTAGEIVVRAPWATQGYFKNPEAFEFLWADGYLHDQRYWGNDSDGYLQITDRLKDVIKTGGEWVSSIEIEDLVMLHPAVAEAAVIGVRDDKWGERPLAIVALKATRWRTRNDLPPLGGIREFRRHLEVRDSRTHTFCCSPRKDKRRKAKQKAPSREVRRSTLTGAVPANLSLPICRTVTKAIRQRLFRPTPPFSSRCQIATLVSLCSDSRTSSTLDLIFQSPAGTPIIHLSWKPFGKDTGQANMTITSEVVISKFSVIPSVSLYGAQAAARPFCCSMASAAISNFCNRSSNCSVILRPSSSTFRALARHLNRCCHIGCSTWRAWPII